MKTISTIEAKKQFEDISKIVQTEPVRVLEQEQTAFVALSLRDYEHMMRLDRKLREDVKAAIEEARADIARHNLSDEQKRELLSEYNLADDD